MKTFQLNDEYVELIKLLKFMRVSMSGAEAKMMVEDGLVRVNGATEYRKRAKLRSGDVIEVQGESIRIE